MKDERGHALVMAVTAVFLIGLLAHGMFTSGRAILAKIRMQNAADAAAVSGAALVARCLNTVAGLNQGIKRADEAAIALELSIMALESCCASTAAPLIASLKELRDGIVRWGQHMARLQDRIHEGLASALWSQVRYYGLQNGAERVVIRPGRPSVNLARSRDLFRDLRLEHLRSAPVPRRFLTAPMILEDGGPRPLRIYARGMGAGEEAAARVDGTESMLERDWKPRLISAGADPGGRP